MWDPENKIGGIYYIDPDDGQEHLKKQLVTEADDGYLSWIERVSISKPTTR